MVPWPLVGVAFIANMGAANQSALIPSSEQETNLPVIKTRSRQKNAISGGSMDASAELGVLFGCLKGVCGKCATTILSGLNNLSAPTEEEVTMDMDPDRRLMCQCHINKGTVKLDLD